MLPTEEMERKRITCPETGHLEEVELERTPSGLVIAGCSRFQPRCAVDCPRECARRMDRRDQRDVETRERVLVVYSSRDAQAALIAEVIADDLKKDGLTVELADAEGGGVPPPADYDAVVIGVPKRFGRYAQPLVDYIRAYRDALAAAPAFVFSVSTSAYSRNARRSFAQLAQATGWQPTEAVAFDDVPHWPDVHEFALRVAEEVPAPLVQPSFL